MRTSHLKKDAKKLKLVRRATRMISELKTKPYKEKLKELAMFSLNRRRLRLPSDMIALMQFFSSAGLRVNWLGKKIKN